MTKAGIMRKSLLLIATLLTVVPLAAHEALAQQVMTPGAPAEACKAPNVTPDARVTGCTTMIEAKQETGRSLAVAYCNRGFAFTEQRDFDRAMADLNEAIKIDPTYACSFSNRGRVYAFKGDTEHAIAD